MTPQEAYGKCNGKINKDLEPYFIKDPHYAYLYAQHIIKGRWIEAEPIVMKDPSWACYYATYLIKDRWIEAEYVISTDSYYSYIYAKCVINGKLPENMHNAMMLHALHTENHAKLYHTKLYFDFIKNKPQQ